MKELRITKGEWVVDFDRVPNGIGAIAEDIAIVADDWDIAAVFSDITDDGEESKANALLIADAGNTAQKCGLLPSELLRQRDELKEALAEQKRLYFNLFDEEISCMYCEAKIRRGSAIILCKECAENTEL